MFNRAAPRFSRGGASCLKGTQPRVKRKESTAPQAARARAVKTLAAPASPRPGHVAAQPGPSKFLGTAASSRARRFRRWSWKGDKKLTTGSGSAGAEGSACESPSTLQLNGFPGKRKGSQLPQCDPPPDGGNHRHGLVEPWYFPVSAVPGRLAEDSPPTWNGGGTPRRPKAGFRKEVR